MICMTCRRCIFSQQPVRPYYPQRSKLDYDNRTISRSIRKLLCCSFYSKRGFPGNSYKGNLTRIGTEKAFSESFLSIPEALMNQTWPLIDNCRQTPLEHSPAMPLTTLQKRWLKSLLLDPRVALFQPDISGPRMLNPSLRQI